MIEKFKKHWFISLIAMICATAATSWKFSDEINVKPRDYTISELKEKLSKLEGELNVLKKHNQKSVPALKDELAVLVLPETGVSGGNSVTTKDGICKIFISSVETFGDSVSLKVIIDSKDPVKFTNKTPGDRIRVDSDSSIYFIDINRVRGNIVDISVYRKNA